MNFKMPQKKPKTPTMKITFEYEHCNTQEEVRKAIVPVGFQEGETHRVAVERYLKSRPSLFANVANHK